MTSIINILPKPLLENIFKGNCIPIIGAGFSRNAEIISGEIPLWSDLGKYFAKELNIPYFSPLDAISNYCTEFGKIAFIEELRDLLKIDQSRPGNAHLLFADLFFDTIITTNYDFLLEKAFEKKGKTCHTIVEENQLSLNYSRNLPLILKIHGDFNHHESMVITEEDYDLYLTKHPLFSTYISSLLIRKTPLLIGYSLDDPDFRQLLQIIKFRLGKFRRIVYCIAVNPTRSDIIRFSRRGIKVIKLNEAL